MSLAISSHFYSDQKSTFKELDLYIPPEATDKSPLLVFIHGGAWRSEDKAEHAPLAQALAARGFPVAAINYRLSVRNDEYVQHPTHIQDAKEAIDHLKRNRLGPYDPARMYLIGHSAGAHIAMMLVLDPMVETQVAGVIGAQGIYDLSLLLKTFPSYDFVAQAFGEDASKYAGASPVSKTPHSSVPPVLVIHSLEDELVDLPQANAMVDHLKAIGAADVRLDTNVKGTHFVMVHAKDFVDAIVAFVS
ncbi:Alpha/Beta hydrolase protein [Fennellomyces sp. T-0311]|nr:Alpha/Beta hydrolase protein [Fennellomyces sp. T-0311]